MPQLIGVGPPAGRGVAIGRCDPTGVKQVRNLQRQGDMMKHANNTSRAPWWVSMFNPLARLFLRAGIPLGPNGLVTIRGRKSGVPRENPVAIIEVDDRRWIWAPWGDVNWVRNLREAGLATITKHGRQQEVRATELDREQRLGFFRDVLGPVARRVPSGVWFVRTVDGVDLDRPAEAADGRPVFELEPV